jgi:tripartite ATP-independent transporter DctM subunit
MGYIAIRALLQPDLMPDKGDPLSFVGKIKRSVYLMPVVGLILAVLGSIYFGIATATEAAVLGVIGALVLSALQGSLTWENFKESLLGATRTSCMIALILAGAHFLTLAMGFTGLPRHLAEFIGSLELSPLMLIFALTIFYIVLGCFLDGISSVVLTMAVVEPMIRQAGIDIVWFGIFLVIVVEMAQITPPVGFNLFVLQGMTHHDMGYIARAAVPMFLVMVVAVGLIVAFPEIVMYLPETMRQGPG